MRALLLVLGLSLLVACGDDDAESSRACGEQGCSAECEQLRGENCDILEADCRERIFDAVVCVRGTPGELPPVRTLTEDEYRAELTAENDADAGVEEAAAWSTGLALVGLLDPNESAESAAIDDLIEDVAGYYDPDTSSITLIDRDHPEDSDGSQSLLAHELVHALQDQEMGLLELGDRTGRSYDALYARRSLTEGEATLYEELALELLRGLPLDTGYLDVSLAWRLKFGRREVAIARSPVSSLWQLSYPIGGRFLVDAWLAGGNAEVQGLYWGVPQSTIYWMHGYDAFVEHSGQLVRPLACNTARGPEGFELETFTSLGSFAVYALLAHVLVDDGVFPSEAAWQDALSWRQDSFSVFTSADEGVAVSWRILFMSGDTAERVAEQLSSDATVVLETRVRGAEIEVLAAESELVRAAWSGTDPDDCPDAP